MAKIQESHTKRKKTQEVMKNIRKLYFFLLNDLEGGKTKIRTDSKYSMKIMKRKNRQEDNERQENEDDDNIEEEKEKRDIIGLTRLSKKNTRSFVKRKQRRNSLERINSLSTQRNNPRLKEQERN